MGLGGKRDIVTENGPGLNGQMGGGFTSKFNLIGLISRLSFEFRAVKF
jgi:hypothetical protein